MLYHRFGTFRTEHITITNHYGIYCFSDITDNFPICFTSIHLLSSTPMNRYSTYTSIFTSLALATSITLFILCSSQPIRINSNWFMYNFNNRCEYLMDSINIFEKCRPCLKLFFGKLWHWTTHIYIKKITFRILSNIFCRTKETLQICSKYLYS